VEEGMYIRLIDLLLLTSGCTPNIILGQVNHWRLKAYVDTDEAKRYCAKKGKTPGLVFKDGWTYKFECVDK
jgi:hypothetical protein